MGECRSSGAWAVTKRTRWMPTRQVSRQASIMPVRPGLVTSYWEYATRSGIEDVIRIDPAMSAGERKLEIPVLSRLPALACPSFLPEW